MWGFQPLEGQDPLAIYSAQLREEYSTMKIGDAAGRSGISAKMIRYYETTGLIPPAGRGTSNYRDYSDGDVHELRFIRRARDLGFSVAEIADLLGLWRNRERQSATVKTMVCTHIAKLRMKIEQLQAMADTLQSLADNCSGNERPHCPIMDRLGRSPQMGMG